jgi:hypothetical protein
MLEDSADKSLIEVFASILRLPGSFKGSSDRENTKRVHFNDEELEA